MARSDLLISLIKADSSGDRRSFDATTEAIIAEERAKHHDVLAEQPFGKTEMGTECLLLRSCLEVHSTEVRILSLKSFRVAGWKNLSCPR
jgi:hypothetical protein